MVSGRVTYRYNEHFSANVSYRYVSTHDLSTSPMGSAYYELGGYSRLDANVAYSGKLLDRDIKVTLYGRNLGNKAYATRYVTGAYYDPGISYGVQLAYSFF